MDLAINAKQCVKLWDAFTTLWDAITTGMLLPLSDEDIEKVNKRQDMDDLRREYIREEGYTIKEIRDCEWWQNFRTNETIKYQIRSNFTYKRPLSTKSLLEKEMDPFMAIFSVT